MDAGARSSAEFMMDTLRNILVAVAALLRASAAIAQIPTPADAPKPLTPEQTAALQLPDGFRMEVVASEPLIASPSAVCWDERGRMFVCELHGYNLEGQLDIEELNKTGKLDTQVRRVQADEKFKRAAKAGTFGVVKMLRDTDGDGRMDAADVWATDLPPAYGLVPARGGVIVACAPDIVFLADRDGDGRAEMREVLFTGFPHGRTRARHQRAAVGRGRLDLFRTRLGRRKNHRAASARTGARCPDSDFRIRADGSAIEPVTGAHAHVRLRDDRGRRPLHGDDDRSRNLHRAVAVALSRAQSGRGHARRSKSPPATAAPTRFPSRIRGGRSARTTRPISNTTTRATARRRARRMAGSPPRAARWCIRTARCRDCAGNISSANRREISSTAR